MASLSDYTDEELGRLVREAARGREEEIEVVMQTQYDFAYFLEEIGLTFLAEIIMDAISEVWEGIKGFFRNLFC